MDRAVQIAGTTYESVPSVTIPTTGGGEASFVEISDTTALAADVASGKFFYTADGIKTQGTASGGGTVVIYKDSDGYIVIGSEDCGVDGLVSKDSDGYIVIPEELIAEIKLQGKTATPTEEYQAIYPDSGYDGLEYVGVDPIPSAYADVTDTTAVATDVAAGKIFYTSEGVRTSGTASGGGGGISADDIASHSVEDITLTVSRIQEHAFYGQAIKTISAPNVTQIDANAFSHCTSLKSVIFPEVVTFSGAGTFNYAGASSMAATNCILVFPKLNLGNVRASFDRGYFLAVDIGPNTAKLYNDTFYHSSGKQTVGTLILRRTAEIVTASTLDTIKGLRDVYVPSALITQYEAAKNWSTRVSDGYITFHAIEGSQYENYYADGTPIT